MPYIQRVCEKAVILIFNFGNQKIYKYFKKVYFFVSTLPDF